MNLQINIYFTYEIRYNDTIFAVKNVVFFRIFTES